jgi:hypothetical protein
VARNGGISELPARTTAPELAQSPSVIPSVAASDNSTVPLKSSTDHQLIIHWSPNSQILQMLHMCNLQVPSTSMEWRSIQWPRFAMTEVGSWRSWQRESVNPVGRDWNARRPHHSWTPSQIEETPGWLWLRIPLGDSFPPHGNLNMESWWSSGIWGIWSSLIM